jgi:hypothetical protein
MCVGRDIVLDMIEVELQSSMSSGIMEALDNVVLSGRAAKCWSLQ